jgi:chemotaxis protein MotB
MNDHPNEIVIVRRRGGGHAESPHGGAWKIAFADFMTAMMAFFLVLWIISATDKNTKTLIARYFNPVKVEEPAKSVKGIHGAPEQNTDAPGKDTGAPNSEKSHADQGDAARGAGPESPEATPGDPKQRHKGKLDPRSQTQDPSRPQPTMSEAELFSDPRASLDKIAGAPPPGPRVDPAAALKGFGEVGPSADEALRDPFHPLGSDKAVNVMAPDPGAPPEPEAASQEGSSAPPAASAPPNAGPRQGGDAPEPSAGKDDAAPAAAMSAPPNPAEAKPAAREVKSAAAEAKPPPDGTTPAAGQAAATAEARAAALLAEIRKRLGPLTQSASGPLLDVQATEEGVLVSLTDRQNFSMFAIGSAEPQPKVVQVMDAIAMSLETLPGTIVVRGHTDGRPYRLATYDNWRLSSARAQMAYYMLARGGVAEKRFDRIEGFADHRLRDRAHPLAAENRRIEILLREVNP